jgi:DNA-binding MarR family transcriptional regulator
MEHAAVQGWATGTREAGLDNSCFNKYAVRMVPTVARKARSRRHFDSPQQEAYLNLWRTYDRLRELEDQLFGSFGLTAQQYNTLRLLRAAHPGKVPTLAIASRLISRAPDITRLLDRLHDRGLVERERPSDNRRVVNVGITEAGLNLLDELADQVKRCHADQLGHLSPAELRKLVALLKKARQPHEPDESSWG